MATLDFINVIQPFKEMVAYETIWLQDKMSFKKIAEEFAKRPSSLPSSLIGQASNNEIESNLLKIFSNDGIKPNILINGTYDYPERLRDAKYPIEVVYYRGNIDYLYSPKSIAVVGSRKPTKEGMIRARKLVKMLVADNVTIFSGLADGIDTIAHRTAIMEKGRTVAVIGTPLNQFYPKQNKKLQEYIAKRHLLISQVPFIKYTSQDYRFNRGFFPERNKTMSALSDATVIIEASDTSGTLIQAKAALEQGRKLFILQNCFENKRITWPDRFEKLGAIRVVTYEDIKNNL